MLSWTKSLIGSRVELETWRSIIGINGDVLIFPRLPMNIMHNGDPLLQLFPQSDSIDTRLWVV